MNANIEKIFMGRDPLNVMADEVKPLPEHVIEKLIQGRRSKTRVLDGSSLEQHSDLIEYASTQVKMNFDNEDDLIRCVRLLQWSDERMRSRTDPKILWKWKESYRTASLIEFTVSWYSKDFFEEHKNAFMNPEHSQYYAKFGMNTKDINIQHEIH